MYNHVQLLQEAFTRLEEFLDAQGAFGGHDQVRPAIWFAVMTEISVESCRDWELQLHLNYSRNCELNYCHFSTLW